MKKIYSKPSIKVMEVEAEQLLAASPTGDSQGGPTIQNAKGINMWLLDDNEVESTSSNIFDDENW